MLGEFLAVLGPQILEGFFPSTSYLLRVLTINTNFVNEVLFFYNIPRWLHGEYAS